MFKKLIVLFVLLFSISSTASAQTIYPVEKFIDGNKIYDGVEIPIGGVGPVGPQGPQGIQGIQGPAGSGTGSQNTYNIKDFGAIGDGVADDTIAIQAAWDAMIASGKKGSKLYIPLGTYAFSSTLNFRFISFWDAEIYGDGNSSTLKWIGDNTTPKPAIRLIGPLKSVFRDFRVNAETPVSTMILQETSTGVVVTRSNKYLRVRFEGNDKYEKGIQFTAGDHVSLSFPSIIDAAGIDGNNDHNNIEMVECAGYTVACLSFENTQGKVNYIEQLQADASVASRDRTIAAMIAAGDVGTNTSLDQGPNGMGPYAITTSLSKGGQVGNGGGFYINGGVFHNNVIDIYMSTVNRDPLSIYGNVNSETGLRFLQVGPRGWASFRSPVHVTGVTWTSNKAVSDLAGIVTIGHMGPTKFEENFFHASNNVKLNFGIGNKDGPIDFSHNLWEWSDGVDGSVNHDPFTVIFAGDTPRVTRRGNTYVDPTGVAAFRSDELPDIANTAQLIAGAATITIGRTEQNLNYLVMLTGDANENFHATNKTLTTFDIVSSNPASTANVYWRVTW